jgi:NifU-like protein involved in Fe-S cluster formation
MTEYYKGQRISELLKQIKDLQDALRENADAFESDTQALMAIEAWASLTIAKAKLTSLQKGTDE